MAPVAKHASSKEKDLSAPLEGPVSVLWAYQLRREHTFLKSLVDCLADTVRTENSAAQIKQINLDLEATRTRVTATEKKFDSHRSDLQEIRDRVSSTDEAVTEVQVLLSEYHKQHHAKHDAIADEQKMSKQIQVIKAELERSFKSTLRNHQEQIHVLQSKTIELEGQVKELSSREFEVVRNSIEDIPRPNFDFMKPQLISNKSKNIDQRPHKAYSHANDLLEEVEEQSNILTVASVQRTAETPATEFDLDAGFTTMSYASHMRRNMIPEESMVMLPELPQNKDAQIPEDSLHISQGDEQAWEAYLMDGRRLVRSSLKRKNGVMVDLFVAGLLDAHLRTELEWWLDDRVWLWEHVEGFAAQKRAREQREPSSTAEPTPNIERRQRLTKEAAKPSSLSREVARLLENQERLQRLSSEISPVPESKEPDDIRRSQRLAKKTVERSHPPAATQQPPEANRKRQRVTKKKKAPSKKQRTQSKKQTKAAKSPAKPHETVSAQSPPEAAGAAKAVQAPILCETEPEPGYDNADLVKGWAESGEVAVSVEVTQAEKPDMELDGVKDSNFRAKAQQIRTLFPKKSLRTCYEALLKKNGHYAEAREWIVDQTRQLPKPKSKKVTVLPPTPTPINRHSNTLELARTKAIDARPDLYMTPQHQVIGRTSYKRKLNCPEQNTAVKRARIAKKPKRGPPPMIPILPSSETE